MRSAKSFRCSTYPVASPHLLALNRLESFEVALTMHAMRDTISTSSCNLQCYQGIIPSFLWSISQNLAAISDDHSRS